MRALVSHPQDGHVEYFGVKSSEGAPHSIDPIPALNRAPSSDIMGTSHSFSVSQVGFWLINCERDFKVPSGDKGLAAMSEPTGPHQTFSWAGPLKQRWATRNGGRQHFFFLAVLGLAVLELGALCLLGRFSMA
jgi:hypothetical protein